MTEPYALFRITTGDRARLEKLLYLRYPEREWGTFFRFGFRLTSWGVALSFIDGIWPQVGDLDRRSAIVEISSEYSLRAVDTIETTQFGVGMIHSHPEDCITAHSRLDDDMDGYYAELFGLYGETRPYCSLIFSHSSDGKFRFSGRVWIKGRWIKVHQLLTVGETLLREDCETFRKEEDYAAKTSEGCAQESPTARLRSFLGGSSADRLSQSTVVVIGCSGTGSPAVEVLARAGVASFVLVDFQRLALSNLERLHGSTLADLDRRPTPFKTDLLRDLIHEINPSAKVTTLVANVLEERVLDEILHADIVLCCTDTQHSRAFLGDLASHYLVPSLDVGVSLESTRDGVGAQLGQFTQFAPHLPCAFCEEMTDPWVLACELMSEEEKDERRRAGQVAQEKGIDGGQYWHGERPPLLTVGYLTSTVGSLVAGYAIGWLTGAFKMPHSRFQIDITASALGVVEIPRQRSSECSCGTTKGFADQARAFRSVSLPMGNGH
jgi:hypothetical protein